MYRLIGSILWAAFFVQVPARADAGSQARAYRSGLEAAQRDYSAHRVGVETKGADHVAERLREEWGLVEKDPAALKSLFAKAGAWPEARVQGRDLVFVIRGQSAPLKLRLLDSRTVHVEFGDTRFDWVSRGSIAADRAELERRFGAKRPDAFSRLLDWFVPTARADMGTVLTAILVVAVIVGGYYLVRKIGKAADRASGAAEAQINENGNALRSMINRAEGVVGQVEGAAKNLGSHAGAIGAKLEASVPAMMPETPTASP